MYHDVRTISSANIARFGSGAVIARNKNGSALDEDTLRRAAPSVFAEGKHGSRSERYTYIPTVDVLRGLGREGFLPFEARQGGSRTEGKRDFTKHLLRLRQAGELAAGDSFRELILLNSHDGTSSYQLMAGRFRLVCSNGLVCADGEAHMVRIPHKGDVVQQVIDAAFTLVDQGKEIDHRIEEMRRIELRPAEQEAFAEAASELRWEGVKAPVTPRALNAPRRREDNGDSLWLSFNRTQENLTQGGLRYTHTNPETKATSRRETQPVRSIDGNTGLNRALWVLAARMQELKA